MDIKSTRYPGAPLTLTTVAIDLYDACKVLKRAWDLGEKSNEVDWEELTVAVALAAEALEKVNQLSSKEYCVLMHTDRDSISGEALFWSVSKQWVSLHDADVFAISDRAVAVESIAARFPPETWGFVELPSYRKVNDFP